MRDLLYTNMEDGMKNYNQTGYEGVTHTWDIIQLEVMNKIIQYSALQGVMMFVFTLIYLL